MNGICTDCENKSCFVYRFLNDESVWIRKLDARICCETKGCMIDLER